MEPSGRTTVVPRPVQGARAKTAHHPREWDAGTQVKKSGTSAVLHRRGLGSSVRHGAAELHRGVGKPNIRRAVQVSSRSLAGFPCHPLIQKKRGIDSGRWAREHLPGRAPEKAASDPVVRVAYACAAILARVHVKDSVDLFFARWLPGSQGGLKGSCLSQDRQEVHIVAAVKRALERGGDISCLRCRTSLPCLADSPLGAIVPDPSQI